MNILIVGSSAREHAIADSCAKSELVDRIFYWGPENGGMSMIARRVGEDVFDFDAISDFSKEKLGKVGLAIIGPERPLAKGLSDHLNNKGILTLGPGENGARVEASKYFCHLLLESYGIPAADYRAFISPQRAKEYIKERYFKSDGESCVLKANELMDGKGVVVPDSVEEAVRGVDELFAKCKDKLIVVERRIRGEEYSFTAITDGLCMIPFVAARDYKREGDGDTGPNTGGQGCFAPALRFDDPLFKKMKRIAERVVFALWNEGIKYRGFLYIGFMVDKNGDSYILEINARLGNPEAQVILPLVESDFVEVVTATAKGDLRNVEIDWKDEARVCVVISSPKAGYRIYGLEGASEEGAVVFHTRTRQDGKGHFYTTGPGRILSIVGGDPIINSDITSAIADSRDMAYTALKNHISFYRKNPKLGRHTYRGDIARNI